MDEVETCPAGLDRGLVGWSGLVRLGLFDKFVVQ